MNISRGSRVLGLLAIACLSLQLQAQVSVLTQHNDTSRTGKNLAETVLNTSNVNVSNFGKLFARAVDGYLYAQPLYVPSLSIGGKTRNVVYVATEHNSVYAFDADDPAASSPLWQVNLGSSVPSQDICTPTISGCPYTDLIPEIGITATPVIDSKGGAIYVVAKTKNTSNNTYHFFLHALDLLTGAEKFAGPVEIKASSFTPLYQLNRPGLLLLNGVVYAAFGSVGDYYTWHGFVIGYNSSTLAQVAIYNATPGGKSGGIWAGGQGLMADTDNIYLMTGNGTFDVNTGGQDYGDSVVKLSTSTGLGVADYFTPDNQSFLFSSDVDLGSGGPLALPGTSLLVAVGKDGIVRLINTGKMGGFNSLTNNDAQEFHGVAGSCGGATGLCFMGAPIYWDSPSFGPVIYLWGSDDYLKAYKFNGTTFQTTPISQGAFLSAKGQANTGALSVSSNGAQPDTGILWAAVPYSGDADANTVPGILYAFDASNLGNELWDSKQDAARDDVGNYAKFNPPTVANGKVYLGTFSGQLLVYGTNPTLPTGIHFVQVKAATPSSASSVTVSYPNAEAAGDLNLVVIGWNDATSSIQSVKDSAGNTYQSAVPVKRIGSGSGGTALSQAIYYAANVAAGSNTVTVTFNQAAVAPDVRVLEYFGVGALNVTASDAGNSSNSSSGPATTTSANELVFGANTVYTRTAGSGSGFTARIITSPDSDIAEDEIVSGTGVYTATAPLAASGTWVMQMATFRPASSSPAPTISGVSPNSGPATGGTAVTITGTNFASGATVSFGGVAAGSVSVSSSTLITASTPAQAAGSVNVSVSNSDGQSATLGGGFTYTSSSVSQQFVQVNAATPHPSAATVGVSYLSPQGAGDLNVVVVGWNDTTSVIQSVVDSAGNVYSLAAPLLQMGSGTGGTALSQAIYYKANIHGGSNTVTVSFNQAAAYPDVRIVEYSGVSAPDVQAGGRGNSATSNSGAATTRAGNEILFAADMVYTGTAGAGSGYTARIITSPDSDLAEDRMVSSTGTYSATAPLVSSGPWIMQMVTFK